MSQQNQYGGHRCHNPECRKPCKPEWLMCFHCWSKVPAKLKAAVYRTYREGQCQDMRPSAAWHRAADAAIQSVCPSYRGMPERLLKRIEERKSCSMCGGSGSSGRSYPFDKCSVCGGSGKQSAKPRKKLMARILKRNEL